MVGASHARPSSPTILNAIYFKGSWANKFDKALTKDDIFTNGSGKTEHVKMMRYSDKEISYLSGPQFSSVALPYAGGKQSMHIFLPARKSTITDFLEQFTENNWKKWKDSYSSSEVDVSIPKFTIESSSDLKNVLQSMGMTDAFSEARANFYAASPSPLSISKVIQKTYMDVNEEGTEAAAVTAVHMVLTEAIIGDEPKTFRVDRPFVIALVDNDSGEILFLGSIASLAK